MNGDPFHGVPAKVLQQFDTKQRWSNDCDTPAVIGEDGKPVEVPPLSLAGIDWKEFAGPGTLVTINESNVPAYWMTVTIDTNAVISFVGGPGVDESAVDEILRSERERCAKFIDSYPDADLNDRWNIAAEIRRLT